MGSSLASHPQLSHFLEGGDNKFMSWLHDINANDYYKVRIVFSFYIHIRWSSGLVCLIIGCHLCGYHSLGDNTGDLFQYDLG